MDMSTQSVGEERPFYMCGREEYIRRARESCLLNYSGDEMLSRSDILKKIELKRQAELPLVSTMNISNPLDPMKMDAESINRRLKQQQPVEIPIVPEISETLAFEETPIVWVEENEEETSEIAQIEEVAIEPAAEAVNFLTSIRNAEPEMEDVSEHKAESKSFQVFVVRCIVAFLLFVAIIGLDYWDVSIRGYRVQTVYDKIISTELVERVEQYFSNVPMP